MSRLGRDAARGDRISICLAGACAVHCIGSPLLAGILPIVSIAMLDSRVEWVFLCVSLVTSAMTLSSGCLRSHRQWRALAPFAVGAALLLGIRLANDDDGMLAQWLVVAGAGLVVAAHAVNIRLCRRAGADRCGRLATVHKGPLEARVATDSPAFTGGPGSPYGT
jgi:hypothetical protein